MNPGPPTRSSGDDPDSQAVAALRLAIGRAAPADGFARVTAALRAERNRENLRTTLRTRLVVFAKAAAVAVIGLTAFLYWRETAPLREVVVCPHGTPAAHNPTPYQKLRAFLDNPDRFQRVCGCAPLYSGNLRASPISTHPGPDPYRAP